MIYFMRHGETKWNKERRYQGILNSPLTDYGKSQIELVCSAFKRQPDLPSPLKVYVSPLGRAMETAEILSDYIDVEIIKEDRLREISIGSWDGMTKDEIKARFFPDSLNGQMPRHWYFNSPDGEGLESAKNRAASWLSEVSNQTVCAVSHSLIGKVLMGVFLGLGDDELLRLAVAQDAFYKIYDGKIHAVGKGVLNPDEA